MKRTFNKLIRGEKGQALLIVLILMLVGGLIIAPLLAYMGTGLKVGKEVHEKRMAELYAADAGIENAVWKLKTMTPPLPANVGEETNFTPAALNGKTMGVTIYWISGDIGAGTYKVTSVATSADGSNTTIESYIQTLPLLWTHAATSCSTINLSPGSVIIGDVIGTVDYPERVNGDIDPPLTEDEWPFSVADVLSDLYGGQSGYPDNNYKLTNPLDVKPPPDSQPIGPGWWSGNLEIKNSENDPATASLMGTVYVPGNNSTLEIGKVGPGDFTLNLNYRTIYCEGEQTQPNKYAINIGGQCTITGSGCIIAKGNIRFKPKATVGTPGDFIFIMSIGGKVELQPNGNFYGAVAGDVSITLAPGNTLTWNPPPTDPEGNIMLNFPTGAVESALEIRTWDISLKQE
jgi:hypothetical protein